MSITRAAKDLADAAASVQGVRSYRDPAVSVAPPAVVVGPPILAFEAQSSRPSTATFTLYLIVAMRDRFLEQIEELLPQISDAIEGRVRDAVVTGARPGFFTSGGAELPCYELTVPVALNDEE